MENSELKMSVADLPEIYQPIYKHGELYDCTSRSCDDRLAIIKQVYEALKKEIGIKPRILDLGCAQGYISLNIASWGSEVTGVDFLDKNIKVCNLLAVENVGYKTNFIQGKIEEFINNIQIGQYDMVLGLSVFHHLCYLYSWQDVNKMLSLLASKIPVCIFEFAVKEEPLYWADKLPDNWRDLVSEIGCVKVLTKFGTHLSEVARPFVFASNKYVYFEKIGLKIFKDKLVDSHRYAEGTHCNSRRYYIGKDFFVKNCILEQPYYSKRAEINKLEFTKEIDFLRKFTDLEVIPSLYADDINDDEIWIIRELFNGKLLCDAIAGNESFDKDTLIKNTLLNLVALEKEGYYCNDLRTWNVLLQENSNVKLIDYGAMSKEMVDVVWPYDAVLSFFIFVSDVLSSNIRVKPIRNIKIMDVLYSYFGRHKGNMLLDLPYTNHIFSDMYKIMYENVELHYDEEKCATCYTVREKKDQAIEILLDEMVNIHEYNRGLCFERDGKLKDEISNVSQKIFDTRQEISELKQEISELKQAVLSTQVQLDEIENSKWYRIYKLVSKVKNRLIN